MFGRRSHKYLLNGILISKDDGSEYIYTHMEWWWMINTNERASSCRPLPVMFALIGHNAI